jgi:DNA-binding CsgD family transcriptional regulator
MEREALTEREAEILGLYKDKRPREIGALLGLSASTVVVHLASIRKKYEVHSRRELLAAIEATPPAAQGKRKGKKRALKDSRILVERWIKLCEHENKCEICREAQACRAVYDSLV